MDADRCMMCRQEPRVEGKPLGAQCLARREEAARLKREQIERLGREGR